MKVLAVRQLDLAPAAVDGSHGSRIAEGQLAWEYAKAVGKETGHGRKTPEVGGAAVDPRPGPDFVEPT
jgi:hypothetical protein